MTNYCAGVSIESRATMVTKAARMPYNLHPDIATVSAHNLRFALFSYLVNGTKDLGTERVKVVLDYISLRLTLSTASHQDYQI